MLIMERLYRFYITVFNSCKLYKEMEAVKDMDKDVEIFSQKHSKMLYANYKFTRWYASGHGAQSHPKLGG